MRFSQSRNRAPKFLDFRPDFVCSPRRWPPQSSPRSADLSGNLTVDRPQKIRRLGSPSGDDTRKFSLSLALIEWTAMRLISLISASRWIGGLALDQWTFCGHSLDCLRLLRSRSDQPEISRFRAFACAGPLIRREASPTNQRKFRRLDCVFAGRPANERERHARRRGAFEACPISAHYRTSIAHDKRGGFLVKHGDKAPPWVMLGHGPIRARRPLR